MNSYINSMHTEIWSHTLKEIGCIHTLHYNEHLKQSNQQHILSQIIAVAIPSEPH